MIALLNPRDAYHKKAKELLPQLRNAHEVWITEAILIEIGNSLAYANRIAAVSFINSGYVTANVKIVSIDKELLRRAIEFYRLHDDKEWGLTEDIIIDYDNRGNIVGIEVLDASQHVDMESISISTRLETQEEAKTVR